MAQVTAAAFDNIPADDGTSAEPAPIETEQEAPDNNPTEEQVLETAKRELETKAAARAAAKEAQTVADVVDEAEAPTTTTTESAPDKGVEAAAEKAKAAEQEAAKQEAARAEARRALEDSERATKMVMRERKHLEDVKAFKAEKEAIAKERADFEAQRKAVELIETNPLRAFRLLGKSFQKAAEKAVELHKDPNRGTQEELEAMKADFDRRLTDAEKKRDDAAKEAAAKEAADRAEAQERADQTFAENAVREQIKAKADDYELIAARGLEAQLAAEHYAHWKSTGENVPLDKFLAHAEKMLEDGELARLVGTKKAAKAYAAHQAKIAAGAAQPDPAKAAATQKAKDDEESEDFESALARVKPTLRRAAGTSPVVPAKKVEEEKEPETMEEAIAQAKRMLRYRKEA